MVDDSPSMLAVWKQTGGFGCHPSRTTEKAMAGRKATVRTFMILL